MDFVRMICSEVFGRFVLVSLAWRMSWRVFIICMNKISNFFKLKNYTKFSIQEFKKLADLFYYNCLEREFTTKMTKSKGATS